MRLKHSIFLWIFPTALIPVAILSLIITTWSEQRYLRGVERELFANLDSTAAGIERRLLIEQDLVSGLSRVPVVTRFVAMLAGAEGREGLDSLEIADVVEQANQFFETFQSVRVSLETVRLLDRAGSTLVKVRDGVRSEATLQGLDAWPLVEAETMDADLSQSLLELRDEYAGTLLFPMQAGWDQIALYNTAIPLYHGSRRAAYLSIDPPLQPLQRVLEVAPRLHDSRLLIVEMDSERPGREGLVLYDDTQGLGLESALQPRPTLAELYPEAARVISGNHGIVDYPPDHSRWYFQEFLPYGDRLTGWMLILRVPLDQLQAPFEQIRIGIVASVLLILLTSFVLTTGVARRIARPVLDLVEGLTDFAAGRRDIRLRPGGPDEIREAGLAFNCMAHALIEAETQRDKARAAQERDRRLASLGQMAGGIAHEISNPINSILSLATLIERELPAEANRALADIASIREETERAVGIIDAIVSFSRMIGGEQSLFDAAHWVRDSIDLAVAERRVPAGFVELKVMATTWVQGDRRLLQRALLNLLENAVQAGGTGGAVGVEVDVDGGRVVVDVLDDGAGLDSQQLDQAFEPFYTTKAVGQGTGMGLSISLGIVQHHGGSLELSNRAVRGTRARLLLPAAAAAISGSDAG